MKYCTWLLVANASKATIYAAHKAKLFQNDAGEKDLHTISHFKHSESRKHEDELISDNSGRYESTQYGTDTYDPPTDPKKHEEDLFAMEIFKNLNSSINNKEFENLILISPPGFMGMLKKHISSSSSLNKAINRTIEKDYTDLGERDLVKRLQEHL